MNTLSNIIEPRSVRFGKFQALLKKPMANQSDAHQNLTILYNNMTSVISSAELEIERLRDVAEKLTGELEVIRAAALQVR